MCLVGMKEHYHHNHKSLHSGMCYNACYLLKCLNRIVPPLAVMIESIEQDKSIETSLNPYALTQGHKI